MKKVFAIIGVVFCAVIIIGTPLFFSATPAGKALWNNWFYNVQKADDDTNFKTRKKVEDTCRAMMSSYETDKLTYEQYINSDNDEKKSWAEQAKMRANKTASTYNNYILENSFVWEDNIPSDINYRLEYID